MSLNKVNQLKFLAIIFRISYLRVNSIWVWKRRFSSTTSLPDFFSFTEDSIFLLRFQLMNVARSLPFPIKKKGLKLPITAATINNFITHSYTPHQTDFHIIKFHRIWSEFFPTPERSSNARPRPKDILSLSCIQAQNRCGRNSPNSTGRASPRTVDTLENVTELSQ